MTILSWNLQAVGATGIQRGRKGCLCACVSCVGKVWRRKAIQAKIAQSYISEEVTTAGAQMVSSGLGHLLFTSKPSLPQRGLHLRGSSSLQTRWSLQATPAERVSFL